MSLSEVHEIKSISDKNGKWYSANLKGHMLWSKHVTVATPMKMTTATAKRIYVFFYSLSLNYESPGGNDHYQNVL